MLTKKEKRVVNYLLLNKDRYVTSKELANYLGCTDRTVRNYLKSIATTIENDSVHLLSKQGQGHRLEFQDLASLQEFLQTYDLGLAKVQEDSNELDDRYTKILHKLLFEQEAILFDDLADELYVSRSTLSHDFKKIRQLLASFDLTIESRANKGVYIFGNEQAKRRFIMHYFFNQRYFHLLNDAIPFDLFEEGIHLETITQIVLDECRTARLQVSDFLIQNLVVHIALMLQRLKKGFELADLPLQVTAVEREWVVAQRILKKIEQTVDVTFPEEEVNYITLHLMTKSKLADDKRVERSNDLEADLLQAIDQLGLDPVYHLSNDFQFIQGVVTHLETLQIRLENQVPLKNPLLEDIKTHYSDIFYLTSQVLDKMTLLDQKELTDDEIAYVSLHFMAAVERYKEKSKLKVLAICATGVGAAQMLRNRLEAELGNKIKVVDVIGFYDLESADLRSIDLVVTAVDLSAILLPVPVFMVSVFLNPEEVTRIREFISQIQASRSHRSKTSSLIAASQSPLAQFKDYLSEDRFFRWDGLDKTEILEQMVASLEEVTDGAMKEHFQDLLHQREQMGSVVFSDKIAVPHPIRPLTKTIQVAVGISQQPISWDKDHSEIQLIFLLSPSLYHNEGMASVTQKIITLTDTQALQEAAINCQTYDEFIAFLESID